MSNYITDEKLCPKCGHDKLEAMDNVPRRYEYTYKCLKCGYRTQDWKKLPDNLNREDKP